MLSTVITFTPVLLRGLLTAQAFALPTNLSPPTQIKPRQSQQTTIVNVGKTQVMIGSLGGSNINTAVTSALQAICGTGTVCDSGTTATIPNVAFAVEGGHAETGTITIDVTSSEFNTIDQANAMISLIAAAMDSATQGHCPSVTYYDNGCSELSRAGCGTKTMNVCTIPHFYGVTVQGPDPASMEVIVSFVEPSTDGDCGDVITRIIAAVGAIPVIGSVLAGILGVASAVVQTIESRPIDMLLGLTTSKSGHRRVAFKSWIVILL